MTQYTPHQVAVRGHPERGHLLIEWQIKSWAINSNQHNANNDEWFYFIDEYGEIDCAADNWFGFEEYNLTKLTFSEWEAMIKEQEEPAKPDPFTEKHLAAIWQKTKDAQIELCIARMGELEKESIKYFLATGTVNGSFYIRLNELMDSVKHWSREPEPPKPIWDWVEIKEGCEMPEVKNEMGCGNKYSNDVLVFDGDEYFVANLEAVRPEFTRQLWVISVSDDEVKKYSGKDVTHWCYIQPPSTLNSSNQ